MCLALGLLATLSWLAAPALAVPGRIVPSSPDPGHTFEPGDNVAVQGTVIAEDGPGIIDEPVFARLLDAAGHTRAEGFGSTDLDGRFVIALRIPLDARDGTYVIALTCLDPEIERADVPVRIRTPFTMQSPFLGLPVWLWLVVIVSVAFASMGATVYIKFAGLGHVTKCAACGSLIPEDSVRCPRCAAEIPPREPAPPAG